MARKTSISKIEKALADTEVVKIYANSFECALGLGDVALLLKNGDQTVGVVNMSHTVAKTLALHLGELIRFLESHSGTKIMTTVEVEKSLKPQKPRPTTLQ